MENPAIKRKVSSSEESIKNNITSGYHLSFWVDSVEPIKFEPLRQHIETDVVIVGGGISGLSVAYCLAKAGKQVVVIDDGFIGSGETGRTTAHIVNALDDRYSHIESLFGEQKARLAAESHTAAIAFIEKVVHDGNIDCDFRRVDGYLFLHPSDSLDTLEEELTSTNKLGIRTELLGNVPGIPTEKGPSLKFPRQAQFHPMKYLKGLSDAIVKYGGKIYTETHADEFKKEGVKANGFFISSNYTVVATNTPVNDLVTIHTKQHPYRTYVIGAKIKKGLLPPTLWWDTGNMKSKWVSDPYHYVRLQALDEQYDLLISGGQDHKTGQSDEEDIKEEDRYALLEEWTRQRFPAIEEIVYRWSGQVMEPVDSLGFIGKNPGDENTFIVTGDSGNGMTHGTIAGMLIPDLIEGKNNPWVDIYDPSRLPLRSIKSFLVEAGNMAKQYLDLLTPEELKSVSELKAGHGAIITMGLKKVAVYKNSDDVIQAYSAICPHLKCVVHWNGDEKSFDCPCHGSRFTTDGKVVNGPATSDLKPIDLREEED